MDWVIGMEDKTVWVVRGDGELVGIAASDREAARLLVQTNYFNLDDEGMVSYEVEEPRRFVIPLCGKLLKNVSWMLKLFL